MIIRIGCVDGNTYESDYVSDVDIQKEIDEHNGLLGKGTLANEVFTVESMLEMFYDLVFNNKIKDEEVNNATLNLNIKGVDRTFKASSVIWMEVERDKTES